MKKHCKHALTFLIILSGFTQLAAADYVVDNFEGIESDTNYICKTIDDSETYLIRILKNGFWKEVSYNGTLSRLKRKRRSIRQRYTNLKLTADHGDQSATLRQRLRYIKALIKELTGCASDEDESSGETETSGETQSACSIIAEGESNYRIINGDDCSTGQSPVVALKLNYRQETGLCTGTVVARHWILTAAHCLVDRPTSVTISAAGSTYTSGTYYVHPYFSYYQWELEAYDVALIYVESRLTSEIASIATESPLKGETAIVAGYGQDENGEYGTLNAAFLNITLVDYNTIATNYDNTDNLSNPCFGDSGGPILIERNNEWVLAGVTSNGDSDTCAVGDQTRYANLQYSSIASFLDEYLN